MIHWRSIALGGNCGRGVWVGVGAAVGLAVSVRSAAGTNSVGAFAVAVGMPLCVSAKDVLTVDMAVSMISASLTVGVDWPLPQEASNVARNKRINNVLLKMFIFHFP